MTHTPFNNLASPATFAIDSMPALSDAACAGFERLTLLNLATARQAVADFGAIAAGAGPDPTGRAGAEAGLMQSLPGWQSAVDYSRSVAEIVTRTQQEMFGAMIGRFLNAHAAATLQANWTAMFDQFGKGLGRFGAAAADNATAMAGVGQRALATAELRRAA